MSRRETSGQTLLEFAVTLPLIWIVVAGALLLFRAHWDRTRCAYRVFREARQALHSGMVTKTSNGIEVQGRCGEAVETVRLPDLEKAQW